MRMIDEETNLIDDWNHIRTELKKSKHACLFGQERVNMEDNRKCTQCKHFLSFDNFRIKGKGQPTKMWICVTGMRRSTCKECGGSQIFPHLREGKRRKECGGSQICPHQMIRSYCKECKGSQSCKHGRIRSICKDGAGGSI
ncbi:uncharacterized protein LOC130621362 [Hydractinia symbiolongicarpus]|uniref:uncharacterized protein LOC130621362 n=1 Tax=Hydractinia symbiolongicarpus TaxID=13093 RepID=UPI00254E9CC5|nr:uncharacterized protein LOC130621362 [Hydractinia symbiolongicarpus]